jgi:hypothetical protein
MMSFLGQLVARRPRPNTFTTKRAPGLRKTGSRRDTNYTILMAIPLNPLGASETDMSLSHGTFKFAERMPGTRFFNPRTSGRMANPQSLHQAHWPRACRLG